VPKKIILLLGEKKCFVHLLGHTGEPKIGNVVLGALFVGVGDGEVCAPFHICGLSYRLIGHGIATGYSVKSCYRSLCSKNKKKIFYFLAIYSTDSGYTPSQCMITHK
jgi:hypothetical protein